MSSDPQEEIRAQTDPMVKRLGVFAAMKGVVRWMRWDSDHRLKWIDDGQNIWAWDAAHSQAVELVNWQRLKSALEAAYAPDPMPDTALGLSAVRVDASEMFMELPIGGELRRVDLVTYELGPPLGEPAPDGPRLLRKSRLTGNVDGYEVRGPESMVFAGTDERHNLFVREAHTDERRYLTNDGDDLARWRNPDWSPDGSLLVVQRALTDGVNRIPLVDWIDQHGIVEFELRPLPGEPIERVQLWIFDVESGERRLVDAGIEPDHKVFGLDWASDGRYYFLRAHRDLRQIDLLELRPDSRRCRVVMGESHASLFSWLDVGPLVTPVGDWSGLLWRSERDGWAHLYRYDMEGTLLGRVTEGEYVVNDVAGVDEGGGWVYFDASSELHPYDTQLYRAKLDGTETQRLTSERGQHSMTLSPSKDWFVDRFSNLQVPTRADIRRSDGTFVTRISEGDASEVLVQGYSPPEDVVLLAADGVTPLHGVLYKPAHLEEGGRYPILDSIYGGPQEVWAPKTYDNPRGVVPQAMTALGFGVVVLDSRGTPRRGKAFHDAGQGGFGAHVIADHVAGLRQLATENPWIDLDRVGVFGGSWGGHMTIRAVLTEPDFFKVGVAAAGSSQLALGGAYSIEPFLGLPQDNPDAYLDADLVARAGELKGHLMIIHGTLDANAPFGSAMRMTRALIDAKKDFELVVLPGENHIAKGNAAVFRLRKQAQFFLRHLSDSEPRVM